MDFLSIIWNIDPVICKIGPFALRYYSLLFVAGFPLSYWILAKCYRREGLKSEDIDPLLYAMLIGVIVGARLGHCLFYQPDYYLGSMQGFLEIFQPWKGGLASHGAAIGILCACWWYISRYSRRFDISMMWLLDRLSICICLAGACIRLGNFFNSEIYGNPTSLPWGVIFARNGEIVPKHPTQIYEALAYTIMGLLLWALYSGKINRIYRGTMFGAFLIMLFGFRFAIEFIKLPQVAFEQGMPLNMGQLLSIPFIVAGIIILLVSFKRKGTPVRVVSQRTNHRPSPKK